MQGKYNSCILTFENGMVNNTFFPLQIPITTCLSLMSCLWTYNFRKLCYTEAGEAFTDEKAKITTLSIIFCQWSIYCQRLYYERMAFTRAIIISLKISTKKQNSNKLRAVISLFSPVTRSRILIINFFYWLFTDTDKRVSLLDYARYGLMRGVN